PPTMPKFSKPPTRRNIRSLKHINPRVLQRRFRTPTIVVIGSRPNNRAVKRALVKHFPDWRKRWRILSALGPLYQVRTFRNEGPIFYEAYGCEDNEASRILIEWS